MKKTLKTKLRLNSQTIRILPGLKDVHGGRVMLEDVPDDSSNCTNFCTAGCRGCG